MFTPYRIASVLWGHKKLPSKVWTPVRYVTLHLEDRRSASLRHRNRAEITVLVCEQKPSPVGFSRRRRSQNASLRASSPDRGALAAGREKEGKLATTSLKFEYLHRKGRCGEMLIGGDHISNDVITIGTWFHAFFNVCLHSRSFPLRADWRISDSSVDGEPQGNWRRNSNSREVVASSPSFSRPAAGAPRRACSQALNI